MTTAGCVVVVGLVVEVEEVDTVVVEDGGRLVVVVGTVDVDDCGTKGSVILVRIDCIIVAVAFIGMVTFVIVPLIGTVMLVILAFIGMVKLVIVPLIGMVKFVRTAVWFIIGFGVVVV